MAVTITRTPWADDDGTGTTGTVINNAVKTSLYNEIDVALAKVAQLTGVNTFTGNQTVNGVFSVVNGAAQRVLVTAPGELLINTTFDSGGGMIALVADSTSHTGIMIKSSAAANNLTYLFMLNSIDTAVGTIQQTGATTVAYNTSSDARLKDDDGRASDLAALRGIVVHDFRWKADGRRARGVFAQEAHAVFPGAITAGTDDTTESGGLAHPWMTDYSKFVPDLIVGWQQHDAELRALRAQLAGVTP